MPPRKPRLLAGAVLVSLSIFAAPDVGAVGATADGADTTASTGTRHRTAAPLANMTARGSNLIRLLAGAFDPLDGALPTANGMSLVDEASLAPNVAQYWLVQVRDRRFPEATQDIAQAGGLVVGIVPDDTYMVRATPVERQVIAGSRAVRWTGYYQPAWRVPVAAGGKPALLSLGGTRTYRVHVFADDPDVAAVGRALARMPGVQVVADSGVAVDVRATAAQVPAIAALPAVEWVGMKPQVVALNANARWVTDTAVRDVFAATRPGRLNGAGQTAAVADTGVNYTYDLNGRAHVAFRDCDAAGICKEAIYTQQAPGTTPAAMDAVVNNRTDHRKMVAYFDLGATGPNMYDESSHGTHTAGSVDGDQPPYRSYTGDDGLAPAAMHVHQNIATDTGGLVLPADDYDLWRQAYRPRNPSSVTESSSDGGNPADYGADYVSTRDARTHNNSYGAIYPVIDEGSAARLDRFVWDHEDMVIVVSAGNDGPAPASIGSPSVAKNELSSGASANGRQPMVSIDSMAVFSSHGPTADGRYGPDLATPGQIVVSAKGGTDDGYHVAQGTSMSAPILTGLTTLVRQYFYDGYGPAGGKGFAGGTRDASGRQHNPSAALVRAALVNGAVRMEGWYTGDDGTNRALDGQWPSAGQGFGRVNLDNSLYFAHDPLNNWYYDVYRGDAEAFPVSNAPAERTYQIDVADGRPFDVTLAWTDAPNLLPAGTPSLVNNLNLVVEGPDGLVYVGNNMDSRANPQVEDAQTVPGLAVPDRQNLTERVRILDPAPGTYTVTVQADPIARGNQGFALAASGNISAPDGPAFTPGPPLQRDVRGNPTISPITIDPSSSDTAMIRFSTNEPTTATARTTIAGEDTTFVDYYNGRLVDPFPGLSEGPVETSEDYSEKPVVNTRHEIRVTGLQPGRRYTFTISVKDLRRHTTTTEASHTSPSSVFQADSEDIAQCFEDVTTPTCLWGTRNSTSNPGATQLYASGPGSPDAQTGALGAFLFRLPEGAVDPQSIIGASVEMTSAHNWVVPYTDDPHLWVDLLDEATESRWRSQERYEEFHDAPARARAYPETTHKRGGGFEYAFSFRCDALDRLRNALANGSAGFRWESDGGGVFAMDFGFNRRSNGPELRPRLVLFTNDQADPYREPCDPATPAPTISHLGVHTGIRKASVTVSWETDVDSDSFVLFREQGQQGWHQVGTLARTRVHQVQVFDLSPSREYEFAVRSTACNGATTTDVNGGAGYDFYRDPPAPPPPFDPGPRTEHASYGFESGDEGWEVEAEESPTPPTTRWERRSPGHNSAFAWHEAPYTDEDTTYLISPEVTFEGALVGVEFYTRFDTEPTFDFMYVEYSFDGGEAWFGAAAFDGQNPQYPDFSFEDVRFNHPDPGGSLRIRFRFTSDALVSSPAFEGVSVDDVTFASYPNPMPVSEEEETLPLTGPVPPQSAGASGLRPPPTRLGPASREEINFGTSACAIPSAGLQVFGHAHTDYNDDGEGLEGDVHLAVYASRSTSGEVAGVLMGYRDLRRDPPGAPARPFSCIVGSVDAIQRTSEDAVLVRGRVTCDRLASVRRYSAMVTDVANGADQYEVKLFDASRSLVYQWADATTPDLGDLTVRVVR